MKQSLESQLVVDRKELYLAVMFFKKLLKKGFDRTICNLRVMPGGLEIFTPGIVRNVHGETDGLYEFLVPLKVLLAYSSAGSNKNITLVFREGEMKCDGFLYTSPMIKMKNWQRPPVEELPVNYTDTDIIKLGYRKGVDYLEEHNLQDLYKGALNKMEVDIHSLMEILSVYELTKQDLRNLIEYRIKKNLGIYE